MQTAPVFVKIDEYKKILDMVDVLKDKVDKSRDLLRQVNDLKAEEEEEIHVWTKNLDEINRKIDSISKTLFEPDI